MADRQRYALGFALVIGLALVGWAYASTFASIVSTWDNDRAYRHGFLIVPISLWIAWQKRAEFSAQAWQPSWLGVVALGACGACWVIGRGTGVAAMEQLSAVAMIPAVVLAVVGWRATWVLAFPLGFLAMAVPFGRELVPGLMQVTTDVATWALKLSGIPIYRSHMYITIPSGSFEVARGCSGLNYFITGLVLGVLYAYLTYSTLKKRAVCVLAFLIVPILANGLRVYVTIAVSHLTEMRFGPGIEHEHFGTVLFVVVMFAMFWIGRRWQDGVSDGPNPPLFRPAEHLTLGSWAPLPFALLAVLWGPPYLATSLEHLRHAATQSSVQLPTGRAGWRGPIEGATPWRPSYAGARAELAGAFEDDNGRNVDVFVGVYGLGSSTRTEMIFYKNLIVPKERLSLADDRVRVIEIPNGGKLTVREQVVNDGVGERLVWHWFMVGERHVTSRVAVKALEAFAFVARDATSERIITLSTVFDGASHERLRSFVLAHAECVSTGFDSRACGG